MSGCRRDDRRRILRVRGRGMRKRAGGQGDLLVTVKSRSRRTWKAPPKRRWRPTRWPSGPAVSTPGRMGRSADGEQDGAGPSDLGGRRIGRYARADAAYLDRLGWSVRSAVPVVGAAIRTATSNCSARCSGCPGRGRHWPVSTHHRVDRPGRGAACSAEGDGRRDRGLRANRRRDLPWCPRAPPWWSGGRDANPPVGPGSKPCGLSPLARYCGELR